MASLTAQPAMAAAPSLAVQLDLADLPPRQECAVGVQTGVRIGGVLYETTLQLVVRKTRQQATAVGWLVELATLDFVQQATNELEELASYVAEVRGRLLVEISRTGGLLRILNKEELQKKWAALKPALATRYRASTQITPQLLDQLGQVLHGEGHLEEILLRAPEYRLLLPAVFGQAYSPAMAQPGRVVLKRFLGELDLPVLTRTHLAEPPAPTGACTLEVLGWMEETSYPAAGVQQAVRALTNRPGADPTLNLIYRENYVLGPAPYLGVTHAASHTRYEVPGVVGREVTALLTTLT